MSRFVSAVNQPNRVFLSSYDDDTETNGNALEYNNFTIKLNTAILNAKKMQLLRASIPNAKVSIPDYQLTFWYWRSPAVGGGPEELKNVRIYPESYGIINNTTGPVNGVPINRLIANYQDFAQILNDAAAAADNVVLNPYHTAGDVTFAYDPYTRKFSMTGTNINYNYYIAGYQDPAVLAAQKLIKTSAATVQPYLAEVLLNQRVGFVNPQTEVVSGVTVVYGANTPILASSWADLVYSQNVILLTNIVPGSSLGSGKQHNILACVPINAPSLGVGQYSAPLVNFMSRIMKEIYEIQIYMIDDNYQPYNVPQNATVNVELGFVYDNE